VAKRVEPDGALERILITLNHLSGVMAGLVPATHAFLAPLRRRKTWMPATSAGMTVEGTIQPHRNTL